MILILLLVSTAFASDTTLDAIQKIKSHQNEFDQKLKKMGVFGGEVSPEFKSNDPKSKPLFVVHSDLKSSQITQGKFLFGHIVNRLVVSSEGSPCAIELDELQGSLSKSRLLGSARQGSNPERLQIEFTRLKFQSGRTLDFKGVALDEFGAYGVEAQVISQKALMVAGAMASSFISGLAASQESTSVNAFGFETTQRTGRNAMYQGLAQTAADQSKRLIDEATREKPILIVEPGTKVSIFVQEEVKF